MYFSVLYMKVKVKLLSCVRLFATPWTVAHQAPQSMEFSRQEYWSGLPFPSPIIYEGPRKYSVNLCVLIFVYFASYSEYHFEA